MVGGWYCFGDYDIVIIADVPNDESMAAIAMAVAAGGAVKAGKTTVLMTGTEAIGAMKKTADVAIVVPSLMCKGSRTPVTKPSTYFGGRRQRSAKAQDRGGVVHRRCAVAWPGGCARESASMVNGTDFSSRSGRPHGLETTRLALNVVCCETAKCPELGAKQTSRGHRESDALTHRDCRSALNVVAGEPRSSTKSIG